MNRRLSKRSFASALVTLLAVASMLAATLPLGIATAGEKKHTFDMVPSSAAISACLPNATGEVIIETGDFNDKMEVHVSGLAPNTGYDLFVIEIPHSPFGISWYQSDLQTDERGRGRAKVRGIFDVETFSVSPAGSPTVSFPPTHQYHLGLWFDDPQVPFDIGCEPGRTTPAVTPFNGDQHAGIQVLNTGTFPDNAGPLSQIQ
jgi:hypothetical protein